MSKYKKLEAMVYCCVRRFLSSVLLRWLECQTLFFISTRNMKAIVNAEPKITHVHIISTNPNIFSFNLTFGVQSINESLLDINVVVICA
jgi:hypothetical protein